MITNTPNDIAALLLRTAAALEDPASLSPAERQEIAGALQSTAATLDRGCPAYQIPGCLTMTTRQILEALRIGRHTDYQMLSNRYIKACAEVGEALAADLGGRVSATMYAGGMSTIRIALPAGLADLPSRFRPPADAIENASHSGFAQARPPVE